MCTVSKWNASIILRRLSRVKMNADDLSFRRLSVSLCSLDKRLKITCRFSLQCILSNDVFAIQLSRRFLVLFFFSLLFFRRIKSAKCTVQWHGQRKLERTSRKAKGAHVYAWLPALVWDNVSLNRKGTCAACTCRPGRSTWRFLHDKVDF